MALKREAVERVVRLLKQSNAAELEVADADLTVRVRRLVVPNVPAPAPQADEAATDNGGAEAPAPSEVAPAEPVRAYIEAHLVGLFHRGRGPDSEPLVQVGDKVKVGSLVGTIEALRKLTEVRSRVAGEIVEVLVEEGQPVQYGQKLFAVNVTGETDQA